MTTVNWATIPQPNAIALLVKLESLSNGFDEALSFLKDSPGDKQQQRAFLEASFRSRTLSAFSDSTDENAQRNADRFANTFLRNFDE